MFTLDSLRKDAFSWKTALSLASASKLSYEDQAAVQNVAIGSWGFATCEFLDAGDTQGFIAQTPDVFLVAFRGTESLGDWLADLNVLSTQRPYGSVHSGFLQAFQAVHAKISGALAQAGASNRRVWLAGHSLGGALATIAAAELQAAVPITGIHTCGQPRVGDGQFKQFFSQHFADRFFRFVNNDDLVTKVPPGYRHVGKLIHFDAHGNVEQATTEAEAATIEPPPLTEQQFEQLQREIRQVRGALVLRGVPGQEAVLDASVEGLFPSLSDHKLDRYIAAIRRFADGPSLDSVVGIEREMRSIFEAAESIRAPAAKRTTDPLPVLLRLKDANWQAPGGLKVNSQFGTVVSAQASVDLIKLLELDPGVASIEASRDAGRMELTSSLPFIGGDQIHRPPIQERGDAALVGIIDSGVDVMHEAFRDAAGKTRIVAIWNQRDSTGPTPKAVDPGHFTQDYGTLFVAADIDKFVAGTQLPPPGLRDPGEHGTHVASIAAGRSVGALSEGMAPEAKLVVVVPHMKTSPGDPPSLGYSASHVDALHFLKVVSQGGNAVLASKLPIAVNVSLGMNAGAHDGSSTLEAAFDAITSGGHEPGYVIVKSAGNERGLGGHSRVRAFNGMVPVRWDASGAFRNQDYFEVWYSSRDELNFTLVDPAGRRSATVSRTNREVKQKLGDNFCHLLLTGLHPDNGDSRLVLTILPQAGAIATGRWSLEIVGTKIQSKGGQVDVWVERDDARAIRFVDDEPEMTLSIPGTANTIVTVGACHSSDPLRLTGSSSFGLTRDGRSKPDVCAPGFQILAAGAGQNDHQSTVEMTGTSMAAPHVTGALALVLSHRHKRVGQPQYNARQLQAALVRNAKNFSGIHHEGFGFGMLDAASLFSSLQ